MKPTQVLVQEHEIIKTMLNGAEKLLHLIEKSGEVDTEKIEKIIDFSRNYTDRCHHGKEEKLLFLKIEERGISKQQGPVAVMLYEHTVGRELIKKLEDNLKEYQTGNSNICDDLGKILRQYIDLLRAHIMKENNILFPMCDNILINDDQDNMYAEFEELDNKTIGKDTIKKYQEMAKEI